MEQKYLFLITLTLTAITDVFSADGSLLSVVQVFRHGERTPVVFYPTDPYKDSSYWNGLGPGELTDNGKKQLVELGQYFRNRYDGFISTDYSEEELYITSVSSKRNQLSAESFLVGLYQTNDTSIPIHSTPVAVMANQVECIRYDLLLAKLELQDEYFKKVNEENADLYKYVRENSEYPVFELLTTYGIWDTLYVESRANYTLPEWTDSVFPENLTNLTNIFDLSLCYTEEQQQLSAGPFINEVIQHFESIISSKSTQKVRLYSGHDVNIACYLNTFESFTPHNPDFASSLFFELWQDQGTTYINAYYKPHDEMVPITLRGCDFNCKFDDFKSVFKNIVMSEAKWAVKCFTPL